MLLNAIGECRAVDELHDQRDAALEFLEPVDRSNARMIHRRQYLGFAAESRQSIGIGGECDWKYLDRDGALQPAIGGLIDLAHPAGADLANDFVWPNAGASAKHFGEEYMPSIARRMTM